MTTFLPAEKGTPIRVPSTANLMIDSDDRNQDLFPSAARFQITRNESILNGFFTRIGTTEHVLEWNYPNLNADLSNNWFSVDVSGGTQNVAVPVGFYNVADLLAILVAKLNADPAKPAGVTWTLVAPGNVSPYARIQASSAFSINYSPLADMIFPGYAGTYPTAPSILEVVSTPDLRPFRYIDFVSEQLTYNQDLKDAATNRENRNVLSRWYMAYDNQTASDALGYPILMGYEAFVLRRTFNPPKQIRWDPQQPVGNIAFQLYIDDTSRDLYTLPSSRFPEGIFDADFAWLMTLQVSEV